MGSLSDVLKKRRKELGLTLAQIADKMGVAEATVQRWESGNIKSVRHDKIAKLAEILQVWTALNECSNINALQAWCNSRCNVKSSPLLRGELSYAPHYALIGSGIRYIEGIH